MAKKNRKPIQCDEETIAVVRKMQADMYKETGKLISFGDILKEKILKKQKINIKFKFDGGGF